MAAQAPEPLQRRQASWWEVLAVGLVVLGASLALYHRTWARPFSTLAGGAGDADEYTWFLAWVPYALRHGLNPLVSTLVKAPHGVNLMWNTSVLLPSLLVSPLTVVFGTAFSYNVLVTGAPVLNAAFGYAAFRRWPGRYQQPLELPSLRSPPTWPRSRLATWPRS